MSHFFDHFKKAWFFFFLILSRWTRNGLGVVLGLVYESLTLAWRLFVHLFRLLVWLFVHVYMLKRALFDAKKKHKNPLGKSDFVERSTRIATINKRSFVICLSLDKTLLSLQPKQDPSQKKQPCIKVTQIDGRTVRNYITYRPFLDAFLDKCAQFFKVVVYTQMDEQVADEVVQKINRNNVIVDVFARQDLTKLNGRTVKDLSLIKTDLRRVLLVSPTTENVLQKENVIRCPQFSGADKTDTFLQRLASLLEQQMGTQVPPVDLRAVAAHINSQMGSTD